MKLTWKITTLIFFFLPSFLVMKWGSDFSHALLLVSDGRDPALFCAHCSHSDSFLQLGKVRVFHCGGNWLKEWSLAILSPQTPLVVTEPPGHS